VSESTVEIPHGITGYRRHCRCDICRAANSVAGQKWRKARKAKPPRLLCPRCGVPFARCKRAARRDVCIDCHDLMVVAS